MVLQSTSSCAQKNESTIWKPRRNSNPAFLKVELWCCRGVEMQDQKLWTDFSNSTMLQQPKDLQLDTSKWQLMNCRELNCFSSILTWIHCYSKDSLNMLPSEKVLHIITMTCKSFKGWTCIKTSVLQCSVWILAESFLNNHCSKRTSVKEMY